MSAKYEHKLLPLAINQISIQKQICKMVSVFKYQMQTVNLTENSKSISQFRISQFLSDSGKIFSNSKFNLLYAEKKFRIYYKSTLEKINQSLKNVQTVSNYQVKFQPFTSEEVMN